MLSKGYTFPSECDESVEVPQFVTSFIFSGIKIIDNDIIAFYSNHNSCKVIATISKGSEPLSRKRMLQNNSEDYRYYYDSQLKSLSVEAERYYEHNDDSNLDKRREFKSELLDAIDDLDDCAELLTTAPTGLRFSIVTPTPPLRFISWAIVSSVLKMPP